MTPDRYDLKGQTFKRSRGHPRVDKVVVSSQRSHCRILIKYLFASFPFLVLSVPRQNSFPYTVLSHSIFYGSLSLSHFHAGTSMRYHVISRTHHDLPSFFFRHTVPINVGLPCFRVEMVMRTAGPVRWRQRSPAVMAQPRCSMPPTVGASSATGIQTLRPEAP